MTDSVSESESVIIAIRKAVPKKFDVRTIDCAIVYCVILLSKKYFYIIL